MNYTQYTFRRWVQTERNSSKQLVWSYSPLINSLKKIFFYIIIDFFPVLNNVFIYLFNFF